MSWNTKNNSSSNANTASNNSNDPSYTTSRIHDTSSNDTSGPTMNSSTMSMSMSMSMMITEANRPVRQRNKVTHYSDDNPQTFTVKIKPSKRGIQSNNHDDDDDDTDDITTTRTATTTKMGDAKRRPNASSSSSSSSPPLRKRETPTKSSVKRQTNTIPDNNKKSVTLLQRQSRPPPVPQVGDDIEEILMTSTGRIVKRTPSGIAVAASSPPPPIKVEGEGRGDGRSTSHNTDGRIRHGGTSTSSSSNVGKKRRASTGSTNPSTGSNSNTNTSNMNTNTAPMIVEYGINPRTGKMDKRFTKNNLKRIENRNDGTSTGVVGSTMTATPMALSGSVNNNYTNNNSNNNSITVGVTKSLHGNNPPLSSTTTTTTTGRNLKRKATKMNHTSSSSATSQPVSMDTATAVASSEHCTDEYLRQHRNNQQCDTTAFSHNDETIALSHAAALQPILPLPIILPSATTTTTTMKTSSTVASTTTTTALPQPMNSNTTNNVRISTTSALWSERVVPPAGLAPVPKGPTWKPAITISSSLSAVSAIQPRTPPPPIITWFAVREDDSSYAITGNGIGCISLYDFTTKSPDLRPISVIQSTCAARREQQQQQQPLPSNYITKQRTFVSYPNAIVQCHWHKQLILVLTADEMEILQLPLNTTRRRNTSSSSSSSSSFIEPTPCYVQSIAYWSLSILNDPKKDTVFGSSQSVLSNTATTATASTYMWKRINNHNATTQSPCFSVSSHLGSCSKNHNSNNNTDCISNRNGNSSTTIDTAPTILHDNDNTTINEYNIYWTTRSTDTFNPTLLQISVVIPDKTGTTLLHDDDDNICQSQTVEVVDNRTDTVSMKSIFLPTSSTKESDCSTTTNASSSSSFLTNNCNWRCWTTLCEQPLLQSHKDEKCDNNDDDVVVRTTTPVTYGGGGDTFLMIAQTGPDTVELLRCKNDSTTKNTAINNSTTAIKNAPEDKSTAPSSVWKDKTIEIVLRQSLSFIVTTSRGSYHHSNNATTTNGSNNESNGCTSSNQFLPLTDCCMQQYSQFTFITGTGARGIRMYRTETLEAVATFGENVQLHGKTAIWSRCAWIKAGTLRDCDVHIDISSCLSGPASSTNNVAKLGNMDVSSANAAAIATIVSTVRKKKLPWWLERNDELLERQREKDQWQQQSRSKDDDEYWLIGIPHPAKGPAELKTTLYLWKPGAFAAMESETTATLQLPPGGCIGDFYVASKCQRMVCVDAESCQLYDWKSVLRTDFAGVMYPVGYKVITDNLEYIEDEDELDEVVDDINSKETHDEEIAVTNKNEMTILDPLMDSDLAEAMRLSLLELQRQQTNALREEKISVLCDSNIGSGIVVDDFVIPPWPDRTWADGDEPSTPGSPQRSRALSNVSFLDCNSTFELSFLNVVPHCTMVRHDVKVMMQKRIQREEAAENGSSLLDKPKPKTKRARSANVEVLLQSSIDSDLRQRMGDIRAMWAGTGETITSMWTDTDGVYTSTLPSVPAQPGLQLNGATNIPHNETPSEIVNTASPEEKSLAIELLHLSPSSTGKSICNTLFKASLPNEKLRELSDGTFDKQAAQCIACAGRFVLHSCGIRENPIDYDEIARLEQEEKEREDEERQKERMEKKRQAEAKRKESRRKKKEGVEQQKCEGEGLLHVPRDETLYADRGWEQQRPFQGDYSHPSSQGYAHNFHYREKEQMYGNPEACATSSDNEHNRNHHRFVGEDEETSQFSNPRPWGRTEQELGNGISNHGSIHINGTEVKPSTSLHPMDALEALAGLAGSMAMPVPIQENIHHFNVAQTPSENDRYDIQNQSNGYGSHIYEDTKPIASEGMSNHYISGEQETDERIIHVAPIAHVDYRDGGAGRIQLELSLPGQPGTTVLTPSLHKPIMDSSLDQAMLLAEMAETVIFHESSHRHQYSSHKKEEESDHLQKDDHLVESSDQMYRPTVEQSPEAEALLALAFSASPKSIERPTVQWPPRTNEQQQQQQITSSDHAIYNSYSPSTQRTCFGSSTSSTHAIVVSQFLQQPMAASLTNSSYSDALNNNNTKIGGYSSNLNVTTTADVDNNNTAMDDAEDLTAAVDDKNEIVSSQIA